MPDCSHVQGGTIYNKEQAVGGTTVGKHCVYNMQVAHLILFISPQLVPVENDEKLTDHCLGLYNKYKLKQLFFCFLFLGLRSKMEEKTPYSLPLQPMALNGLMYRTYFSATISVHSSSHVLIGSQSVSFPAHACQDLPPASHSVCGAGGLAGRQTGPTLPLHWSSAAAVLICPAVA